MWLAECTNSEATGGQLRAIAQARQEVIEGHGGDQRVIAFARTILEEERVGVQVAARHPAAEPEALGRELRVQCAPDRAGAAARGKAEERVRSPGHVVLAVDHVPQDPREIDGRHALAHPAHVHLRRIVGPDLPVVGKEESLTKALAETRQQPVPEGGDGGRLLPRRDLDQALEATHQLVFRQAPDVVLERVGNEAVAHPHPGFPLVLDPALAQRLVHQPVEVGVVGEEHVAAEVPGEARVVHHRGGQAAGALRGIEDREAPVAELVQTIGGAQSGGACADDRDALLRRHGAPSGTAASGAAPSSRSAAA